MRALVAAIVLLASCGGGAGANGQMDEPQMLPEPTTETWSEPAGDEQVRFWPASARVEQGVPYRMTTYTHCGLDYLLDFDGSFWEVASGPEDTGDALGDPEDEGVITLVSADTAVYESGREAEFHLRRLAGPREVHLCE